MNNVLNKTQTNIKKRFMLMPNPPHQIMAKSLKLKRNVSENEKETSET